MGTALQVEASVDIDLLREAEKANVERRDTAHRAGQRLIGGRPVDIREPIDEKGEQGDDANHEKESTIDAHAMESIGEAR